MAEDKPHPASEKRREQALGKGDSPRSREVPTAVALIAGVGLLLGGGERFFALSAELVAGGLRAAVAQPEDWPGVAAVAIRAAAGPLAVAAGVLFAVTLAAQWTAPLRFDWQSGFGRLSRLSPVAGVKRIFGADALIELVRAIAKAAVLIVIGGLCVAALLHGGAPGGEILWMLMACAAAMAVLAAADVPVQRLRWLTRNRMSHDELREEGREMQGSPELRAARRGRQREIASGSVRRAVEGATAVIVNPSDFAVALRYVAGRDAAPVVLFKGRGEIARAVRAAAAALDIPVLRYPELTRALYFTARVGTVIDHRLYLAVAQVLSFVLAVDRALAVQPVVEVPEAMRFDKDGKRERAVPFMSS